MYGFDYVSFCGVDKASKNSLIEFGYVSTLVHCKPDVLYQEKVFIAPATTIRDAERPPCGEVYCTVTKVAAMG